MPSVIPRLILLIKLALRLQKYPNLCYSQLPGSFWLHCPRKDSKEFTDENIQIFKDWDLCKNRTFDYTTSRQRILAALKRSVYLTLVSSAKNVYEFKFNSPQERKAKRDTLKKKSKSGSCVFDGQSVVPLFGKVSQRSCSKPPDHYLSGYAEPASHEVNPVDHQSAVYSKLRGFYTSQPGENTASVSANCGQSSESAFRNTAAENQPGQFNIHNVLIDALLSYDHAQNTGFSVGKPIGLPIENICSFTETRAESESVEQQHAFILSDLIQSGFLKELADVNDTDAMNVEFSGISNHQAVESSESVEKIPLCESNKVRKCNFRLCGIFYICFRGKC